MVRATPFQFTTEVLTKFVPFTVNVKPAPPTVAELGERDVSVGTPLSIMNVCGVGDMPPPGAGLNTVTGTVPPVTRSLLGTVAVKTVGLV